jgi:putative transposase
MKYAFIAAHQQEFPVIRMCQVLNVSESGSYAWRKREPSQRKREDESLGKLIEDAYHNNRQVSGSPRLHAELQAQGVHGGRKRVARLMRERGITVKPKRRKMKTTESQHDHPVAPNLLKRDFTADAPNTKWVADSTGIGTAEGWLSLAAIVDIYSRMPRCMGHEQAARRPISRPSGKNGNYPTEAKSWSGASLRSRQSLHEPGLPCSAQRSRNTSEYE